MNVKINSKIYFYLLDFYRYNYTKKSIKRIKSINKVNNLKWSVWKTIDLNKITVADPVGGGGAQQAKIL